MQPGWCQPVRQEFMENECEALPGVAYPAVRDNRTTINTKTGYDDDDIIMSYWLFHTVILSGIKVMSFEMKVVICESAVRLCRILSDPVYSMGDFCVWCIAIKADTLIALILLCFCD